MKRTMMIAVLMFIIPVTAFATINEFVLTGSYAERIDLTNSYYQSGGLGLIGGSVANNSLGYAFQFTLNSPIYVNQIVSNITVYDDYEGKDTVDYRYKLYGDSGTVPNLNSLFATSQLASYNNKTNSEASFTDSKTAMNFRINSGTYWLAYEREYGQGMSRASINDIRYNTIHNPEPATLLLFGSGLLGALFRRRQFS